MQILWGAAQCSDLVVSAIMEVHHASQMTDEDAGWQIDGDTMRVAQLNKVAGVSAFESIGNAIDYATELERIV